MRWIKIILIVFGGLVCVCLVLFAIALLAFEDDDYRRFITRAATHFTGYAITVEGPFSLNLSSEPSLSAQAIRFDSGPDGDPPPITSIGKLTIRIALWPLVTGTLVFRELLVDDVIMAIELAAEAESDDHRGSSRKTPPDIQIPIFESVRLHNVQLDVIDTAANRRVEVRLRQFSIDDARDTGPLFIKGNGSISDNDFTIDGQLGALYAIFKGADPYPVALTVRAAGFHVSASGTVADIVDGEGLALQLSGEAGELSNFFKLLKIEAPPLGDLKFHATISRDVNAPRVSDLSVTLSGGARLEFALKGAVDNAISGEGADLRFTGSCADPEVLSWVLPANLPELQRIRAAGEVRETDGVLALEKLTIQTDAEQGLSANAGGRMELGESLEALAITDMAIDIALSMPTTDILRHYGIDWPTDMGPLAAQARLTGPLEGLAVEDIFFESGGSGPLRVTSRGRIGLLPIRPGADSRVSQIDLNVTLQADTTAALSKVLGGSIPDFGPLKATALIGDRNGTYGARKLNLLIGDEKAAALTVTGRIASLLKTDEDYIDGIDLTAVARDFPLQPLSDRLGRSLSYLGPLNGRFQIAGSLQQLSISKADLTTLSPQGLKIEATGGIDHIRMKAANPIAGIDFSLTATAPEWVALPVVAGLDLPDLGPLQATASISDRSGSLDVDAFEIRGGTKKQDLLRLQGQILRIGIPGQMALKATVETASRPWVTHYLEQPEVINVPLTGVIRAAGDADGFRIDEIRLATADGEHLAINARGRVVHRSEAPAVDLRLEAKASDPPVIESLTGISLPPFSPVTLNGRITGNAQKIDFSGKSQFGDTVFQSTVSAAFTGPRPLIVASFASEIVQLKHFGIYPAPPPEEIPIPADKKPPPAEALFNDTPLSLDALKDVDLVFSLDAGKLVGRDISIENLDLDITVENGRLHVYPASMVYAAGFTEIGFTLDASGPIPAFDLKITGEDIDVEDLLATAHEPIILSGELSLVVDLHSAGRSKRELAANLAGEFSLAIENGRIRRIVHFLSTDALNLVFATADRRQHVDLNCLVSKIQFQDGVGDIDVLFMDTPRIRAKAAGNVNLASESIDIVINPEQKRRLLRRQASAVRINGPLTQPSFRALPLAEAARLSGKILMPYVFLPERALGNLWYLIRKDRNASPCARELHSP